MKTTKMIVPLLAMMFLAGCGNNSTNQSNSTNTAPTEMPAASTYTNSPSASDMINNNPAAGMTNAPAITNSTDTNLPATTNR